MTGQRILIFDDNEAILEVVAETLLYENFDVHTVATGELFFEEVTSFKPELILLDLRLGGYDGGELCRALKTAEATLSIPVIIFSAYLTPAQRSALSHCDAVIDKPFDLDHFIRVVRKHLPQ